MATGARDVASVAVRLLAPARRWCDAHLRFLAAVAGLSLLAALPVFQFKEMSGHDSTAYLPRFVEFYEGLKGGTIVPRWAPDLGAGYGEPTFNFNPPLLYYLGSFFHALGFTFIASEDLAIFALLLASGVGMYLFAASVWGRHGGLVAAAAYLFAPHMLVRLYVSHALADFAAFPFIPFAFWGLYGAVARKSAPHRIVGVLAVAALMLSSVSLAVIIVPALALCAVWLAWRSRSGGGLVAGAWCIAMGIALTTFFWLPALRETTFVHISRREERIDFHDHFLYIQQLFYSRWGYGLSVRGTGDGLSFAIGFVQLAMLGAAAVLLRPIWRASAAAGAMLAAMLALVLVAVFFMTPASLFVWGRVGALHPLQFPWRFLALVMLASSFACGAPFLLLREGEARQRVANWLMVALIAAIFLLDVRHADPERFLKVKDADYSPATIATKGLAATAREFEPIDVRQFPASPASEPVTVLSGRADVTVLAREPTDRTFSVNVDEAAQLRMNTFYFPGWLLYVDGARTATSHTNPNGLMDFPLAPGTHAVRFVFRDTPLRAWSTRLSLVALAIVLLAPAAEYGWRRRRARGKAAS
jgi:hypothetical protein